MVAAMGGMVGPYCFLVVHVCPVLEVLATVTAPRIQELRKNLSDRLSRLLQGLPSQVFWPRGQNRCEWERSRHKGMEHRVLRGDRKSVV